MVGELMGLLTDPELMEELKEHGNLGKAALRSGMHRNTAAKYRQLGKLPSELKERRWWRTREDPFSEDWPELAERLEEAPELEAKTLFDWLREQGRSYQDGQLRTLQRRISAWRALNRLRW